MTDTDDNVLPPIQVNAQYVKDFSFEVPGAPGIFLDLQNGQPEIAGTLQHHLALDWRQCRQRHSDRYAPIGVGLATLMLRLALRVCDVVGFDVCSDVIHCLTLSL